MQSDYRHTENPFKYLGWNVFAQTVTTSSRSVDAQKTPSWMFEEVLSMPLLQNKAGKVCKKELSTSLREI